MERRRQVGNLREAPEVAAEEDDATDVQRLERLPGCDLERRARNTDAEQPPDVRTQIRGVPLFVQIPSITLTPSTCTSGQ